jgi:hypothetical protein
MGSEGLLRGLTMARPPDPAQVKRQDRRERAILFISLLWYLPFFAVVSLGFTLAWSAASWGDFWSINSLQVLSGILAAITVEWRFSDFLRKRAVTCAGVIEGRVKPRASALGIEAASVRLTGTYVLCYTWFMDAPPDHQRPCCTSSVSVALLDEFHPLAAIIGSPETANWSGRLSNL